MKKLILIMILLFFTRTLPAGTGASRLQFLKFSPSVRASSMADCITSIQGDADNIFYNPAGVDSTTFFSGSFAYTKWIENISFFNAAASMKISRNSSIGLGGVYMMPDDIFKVIDNNGELQKTGEKIDWNDYLAIGNYSIKINDRLSAGANAKLVSETLYTKTTTDIGFDAGLIYKWDDNISLGIAGNNISDTDLPVIIRTGISYFKDFSKGGKVPFTLLLTGDAVSLADSGLDAGLGTELSIWKFFLMRAGYKFSDDVNGLRLGAGIKYNKFMMDYGFSPYNDLGNISRIGLKINF